MIASLINLLRVRQWTKNTFVLAVPFFSGDFVSVVSSKPLFVCLLSFCICSSTVYVINDICDRHEDLNSHHKRSRPLVSGAISVASAKIIVFVLLISLLFLLLLGDLPKTVIGILAGYVALNVAYSRGLKQIPIIDVTVVSSGFVLRLLAGALVTSISPSIWIVLCTWLVSLFLVVGKRVAEINREEPKLILSQYNLPFLHVLLSAIFACTLIVYALYCVEPVTQSRFGPMVLITIPLVFVGLSSHLRLLIVARSHSDPTSLIFEKREIWLSGVGWLAVFLAAIYF